MHTVTEAMSFIRNISTEQWIAITGLLALVWDVGKYLFDSGDTPPSAPVSTAITVKFKFRLTIGKR